MKMFRKPCAGTTEAGKMGLDDIVSMMTRMTKNAAEAINRASLLSSKAGLPEVVPRTNAVAEMMKAASPK